MAPSRLRNIGKAPFAAPGTSNVSIARQGRRTNPWATPVVSAQYPVISPQSLMLCATVPLKEPAVVSAPGTHDQSLQYQGGKAGDVRRREVAAAVMQNLVKVDAQT